MDMRTLTTAVFLVCLVSRLGGQLPAPNAGGVGMGHLHLNVRDPEAHRAFWTTLGGTPVKLGDMEVIKFPDVLVLYNKAEPTGGTEGSVVGHIGFRVKDLHASLEKWQAAGLKTLPGASSHQAFVIAPDEIRVEMTEDTSLEVPIANHHIHFYTSSVEETKAWYVKMFGGQARQAGTVRGGGSAGREPDVFPGAPARWPAPRGARSITSAFEVKDLEAFCRKLEADGVKFDMPLPEDTGAGDLALRFSPIPGAPI